MKTNHFSHIFIKESPQTTDFISPKGGGGELNLPNRNRSKHGNFLKKKFEKLWEQAKKEEENRSAVSLSTKEGFYIEYKSKAGFDLITKSLEDIKTGIRLLNVHESGKKQKKITIATVYIPYNKVSLFLNKINDYLEKTTPSGNPKNKNLIESIEGIKLAV